MLKFSRFTKVLVMALAFFGCQQDKIIFPGHDETTAEAYLSLDDLGLKPVYVESTEGTFVLKVSSAEKWTCSSSKDWCVIKEKQGVKYSRVPLLIAENPWNASRIAELTFLVGDEQAEKKVTIEQAAGETRLYTDAKQLLCSIVGGEKEVSVISNAKEWTVAVIDDATGAVTDWCTPDLTQGEGNAVIKLNVAENSDQVMKTAKVIITAADKTVEVPLIQSDKLEAPVVKYADDGDKMNLSWEQVIGVNGYLLKVTMGNKTSEIELPPTTVDYDLNAIDWQGYVGVIDAQIFTFANRKDGTRIEMGGEKYTVHNLYDETSGDGTVGNEFVVTKPRHLRNVRMNLDKNFKLMADIDMSGIEMDPISHELVDNEYQGEFTGVFDGGKGSVIETETARTAEQYTISNWSASKSANTACGLFSTVGATGVVRNVTLRDITLTGKCKVGGIAGVCMGKIVNCHVTGTTSKVSTPESVMSVHLGGVLGYLAGNGELLYCTNEATVNGTQSAVGGVLGTLQCEHEAIPTVKYCSNKGYVECNKSMPVAGLIADVQGPMLEEGEEIAGSVLILGCSNHGDIKADAPTNIAAGIVGRCFTDVTIKQCFNTGNATARGSVGGIVGRLGGKKALIENCYNTGTMNSTAKVAGKSNAGGIVAQVIIKEGGLTEIKNCFNAGAMLSVGGLANGLFREAELLLPLVDMSGCFAVDEVGKKQTNFSDKYMVGGASGYTNLSATDMTNQGKFAGWDFGSVWEMGDEYPVLKEVK